MKQKRFKSLDKDIDYFIQADKLTRQKRGTENPKELDRYQHQPFSYIFDCLFYIMALQYSGYYICLSRKKFEFDSRQSRFKIELNFDFN